MANLADDFANAKKALVVAPAGCGKTHLITEAVKRSNGRQLILTHTHAGVKALKDRMEQFKVPTSAYHITTLDSFCLRFAAAYPIVSGWTNCEPEGEAWSRLRPSALKVLRLNAMADVLQASYKGVFVDEYQDCGNTQHSIIAHISKLLPCRIVGDPLQAVFAGINRKNNDEIAWNAVEKDFQILSTLNTPHRWNNKNEALGRWLIEIRQPLLKNESFDLAGLTWVSHRRVDAQSLGREQLNICLSLLKNKQDTVIGIRHTRAHCHKLAGTLRNAYSVFEDAEGKDLLSSARNIESKSGANRVIALIEVAKKWLTISKYNWDSVIRTLKTNKAIAVRESNLGKLYPLLEAIRDHDDFSYFPPVLDALAHLPQTHCRSQEVWNGLKEGFRAASITPGISLRDAIWRRRDILRRIGRNPPRHCLSTPLLIKGLQCDHAIVLNLTDFLHAEWLYVALTRASKSLTVLGQTTVVRTTRI